MRAKSGARPQRKLERRSKPNPNPSLRRRSQPLVPAAQPETNQLLAKLALYSHPAIWPPAQLALVLHEALRMPVAVVAWLTASDRTAVANLLRRGRRRIKAFELLERVAVGRAWPTQLAQIHRFVNGLLDHAARRCRRDPDRRLALCRLAHQLSTFLAEDSLAGTPASHELRERVRRALEAADPSPHPIALAHRVA